MSCENAALRAPGSKPGANRQEKPVNGLPKRLFQPVYGLPNQIPAWGFQPQARWAILVLTLMVIFVLPASAQTGGQFCVRAFEDRNGSQTRDANEPLLVRDVVVNLLDGNGVTVASGVLESSPTAAQGILCFQRLPAGQYSAVVTSADLTPTTPTSFSAAVSESGQPVVVEFGAQRAAAPAATPAPGEASGATQDTLLRVGLSAGGALFVMLGMVVLGLIVYAIFFARRRAARPAHATTTGSMRPVHIETTEIDMGDTGPVRRV